MKAIINAELVMRDHLLPEAVLFIEDDKITGFGEMRTTPIPEGCEIIDAQGAYVGPGLVDIHCHAGNGVRFEHDAATAAQAHLPYGTTSMLATLGYLQTTPQYLESIEKIRKVMAQPEGINIAGIYMEADVLQNRFVSFVAESNVFQFNLTAQGFRAVRIRNFFDLRHGIHDLKEPLCGIHTVSVPADDT